VKTRAFSKNPLHRGNVSFPRQPVGPKPKVGVSVSVFDLLSAVAGVANGTNQIATNLTLGVPGIASVSLKATVGERAQGSGWVTVGNKGASVHTAQTRILLNVQLLGSGIVPGVNLPIYVEVASGTATLSSIACGYPDISTSTVHLGATPGIIDAWCSAFGDSYSAPGRA
jgi:uncharacterized membrane protein